MKSAGHKVPAYKAIDNRRKLSRSQRVLLTSGAIEPPVPLRRRHRRLIALIALFGLLFQQLAMAAYVCPLERDVEMVSATTTTPPCHSPDAPDKTRCVQHCHPLTPSFDPAPTQTVPPALLPATTWLAVSATTIDRSRPNASPDLIARATAPPLNIQHCTFQI